MKNTLHPFARRLLAASLALLGNSAFAHVTYSGRDFGAFVADGSEAPATISISNLSSAFGWADAADADFGDSHRTRAFRFKLTHPASITVRVKGAAVGPASALPFPAFSLYSGLCHVPPDAADHDATPVTSAYLASLGGVQPKEGALFTLGDWKIGNDDVFNTPGDPNSGIAIPASLSSLSHVGHAADGIPANYGNAPGIHGDGLADGDVSASYLLPAGDYTMIVGGADYSASINAVAPFTNYGVAVTLTVGPAPDPIVKGGPCSAFPGAVYGTLYPPAINGQGAVTLRAGIKLGRAASYIIARRTIHTTAVAQTGTTAAGTTAEWQSFGDPIINEAGEVAFRASLRKGTGGVIATSDTGVWSDLGGTLALAWREGDTAPGSPLGQRFTTTHWFNLQNGVLYVGAATSDGTTKSSGVWKWDGNTLTKVVVLGDSLTLLDGTNHVVKSVSKSASSGNGNATSRLAGPDGTLALLLTFTDTRSEILTFR